MTRRPRSMAEMWQSLGPRVLPFADAATTELPLSRLLRLSLFQVSVGIGLVLLNGTLNRVMIIELGIPATLVAAMAALPVLFAPARALIGHRSDHHRSVLGWRRVPYIWMGTLIQFGGLAILPFALLVLSKGAEAPPLVGPIAAAVAFFMVGVGLHTAQTAGVALATDLAPESARPRVVALLYVMLLVGMVAASLTLGWLLSDFNPIRLIKIIQGAAAVVLVLNVVALWKQEVRGAPVTGVDETPSFLDSYREFMRSGPATRLLVAVGLGGAGFNMQDILLEPYGAEILGLSVSGTTTLTALMAGGTLCGLYLAARWLGEGRDAHHLAALGAMVGIGGFSGVIFSGPLTSLPLFLSGIACIGLGGGWFSVGTLTASMSLATGRQSGLAIGAWGAVQATMVGLGVATGGFLRDLVSRLAVEGSLGPGLTTSAIGYSFVYHLEVFLLFGTLVALGPLVKPGRRAQKPSSQFGLAEFPT